VLSKRIRTLIKTLEADLTSREKELMEMSSTTRQTESTLKLNFEAELASRDSELRELREVAEKMADLLSDLDHLEDVSVALAAYRKIKPEIKP